MVSFIFYFFKELDMQIEYTYLLHISMQMNGSKQTSGISIWTLSYSFLLISRWHLVRWRWCVALEELIYRGKLVGLGTKLALQSPASLLNLFNPTPPNTPLSLPLSLSKIQKYQRKHHIVMSEQFRSFHILTLYGLQAAGPMRWLCPLADQATRRCYRI